MITNRMFYKFFFLSIIYCSFYKGYANIDPPQKNILFISIDDLRPLMESYGEVGMVTPNLTKFARQGVQFDNAYTNVPVCGASRASIMTGLRPSQTRFSSWNTYAQKDAPDVDPMNKFFKDHGYETISYGKIYHYVEDFSAHWTEVDEGEVQKDYQHPESLKRTANSEKAPDGQNKGPAYEYADVQDDAYQDGKITRKAIEKLKELKKSKKPFFMALGYVAPHLPFIQPQKYWDLYPHDTISLANNPYKPLNAPQIAIDSQHNFSELRNHYLDIPKDGPLSKELALNLRHGYYASVSYLDALIGQLINSLEEIGLRENTVIVFWSDHGFFLGEHGLWCKHSTFQEAIKIPLIISAPGYAKDVKTASMAELVDLYPTLCELSGLESPSHLQGSSLVPVLKNPEKVFKDEIYTRYKNGETIVDLNYSYTEYVDSKGQPQHNMLYDLRKDKNQNFDLSNHVDLQDIVQQYKAKLSVMRDFVNQHP